MTTDHVPDIEVIRPFNVETTALGAAMAAGIAVGVWTTKMMGRAGNGGSSTGEGSFRPSMGADERKRRVRKWNKAVERSMGWEDEDDDARGEI